MIIGISGRIGSGKDTVAKIIQCLSAKYNTGEIIDIINKTVSDYQLLPFKEEQKWEIKKMADKLKEIIALMLNIPREDLERQEVKDRLLPDEWQIYALHGGIGFPKSYPTLEEAEEVMKNASSYTKFNCVKSVRTVRWLLQYLGTELFRQQIHQNIHVNMLFSEYKFINVIENQPNPIAELTYPNWIITDVRFPNEAKAIKDRGGILIRVERDYKSRLNKEAAEEKEYLLKHANLRNNPNIGDHPSETALDDYLHFDHVIGNHGTIDELVETIRSLNL